KVDPSQITRATMKAEDGTLQYALQVPADAAAQLEALQAGRPRQPMDRPKGAHGVDRETHPRRFDLSTPVTAAELMGEDVPHPRGAGPDTNARIEADQRESSMRRFMEQRDASVDDLLAGSFGEWPPKGLDIVGENSQRVRLVPFHDPNSRD